LRGIFRPRAPFFLGGGFKLRAGPPTPGGGGAGGAGGDLHKALPVYAATAVAATSPQPRPLLRGRVMVSPVVMVLGCSGLKAPFGF
jgi:hypothetical protein